MRISEESNLKNSAKYTVPLKQSDSIGGFFLLYLRLAIDSKFLHACIILCWLDELCLPYSSWLKDCIMLGISFHCPSNHHPEFPVYHFKPWEEEAQMVGTQTDRVYPCPIDILSGAFLYNYPGGPQNKYWQMVQVTGPTS